MEHKPIFRLLHAISDTCQCPENLVEWLPIQRASENLWEPGVWCWGSRRATLNLRKNRGLKLGYWDTSMLWGFNLGSISSIRISLCYFCFGAIYLLWLALLISDFLIFCLKFKLQWGSLMFVICLASSGMMNTPMWRHRAAPSFPKRLWDFGCSRATLRLATEGDLFHWVEHLCISPGPDREWALALKGIQKSMGDDEILT